MRIDGLGVWLKVKKNKALWQSRKKRKGFVAQRCSSSARPCPESTKASTTVFTLTAACARAVSTGKEGKRSMSDYTPPAARESETAQGHIYKARHKRARTRVCKFRCLLKVQGPQNFSNHLAFQPHPACVQGEALFKVICSRGEKKCARNGHSTDSIGPTL